MKTNIDCGFGVSIETIENDFAKIYNLKSSGEGISTLGVKIK